MVKSVLIGNYSKNLNKQSGFTLIEVAVAVALLATAFTIIVGLQTRTVDSYIRETNAIKASLYGQYIMTMIEIGDKEFSLGSERLSLVDELRNYGYFDLAETREEESIADWELLIEVSPLEIPPLEAPLKRIDLQVIWGERFNDVLSFVYFIKDED